MGPARNQLCLVGSLASSMHGMYRSTADIDLLADIKPEHVRPLLDALNKSFYVDDEHAVQQAVEQRRSFNAIHFDSVFKVDIFIPKGDAFARKQLERRQLRKITPDSDEFLYVATAEDTILAKLRWYRDDGEVSSTQWSDVLGILGVNDLSLEFDYLGEWSESLGVRDLLERALTSAKARSSS
ncbi:MAG: DUF6036 family nucleotidyltransferase [Pyrinomonadaceae bacterium]